MKWKLASRTTLAALILALASLSPSGCKGANEVTGPGQPTFATPDLSGAWSGAFTAAGGGHCGQETVSFQQKGVYLVAELSRVSCEQSGLYKGVVSANQLSGLVDFQKPETVGHDDDGAPVVAITIWRGSLTGAFDPNAHTLALTISDLCTDDPTNCVPGGTLTLRRAID
jgi:hypothetical protein